MKTILLPILGVTLLLSACGFRPLYGVNRDTPVGVETGLAATAIANIPDREGQYLRNVLIDRFYRTGAPLNPVYKLEVRNLEESITDLDITKTSDTTRAQLRLQAHIAFSENDLNTPIFDKKIYSMVSYNILSSEYATRVSEEAARHNALDDLARQIERHITLALKKD